MKGRESAWGNYPGYRIDLLPARASGRVRLGGQVIAQSHACLLVQESDHDDRLYFPEADVQWHLLEESDHQTHCPFKGDARYWSLRQDLDPAQEGRNVVWAYPEPFAEVAGLKGYVSFDTDKCQVELVQCWHDGMTPVVTCFPIWGDAADLLDLLDVQPVSERLFRSTSYPNPPIGTFIPELKARRRRSVVEGGHQLAQAVVAASKTLPAQRVTSASMIFSKAASFEEPLDVEVNILRAGRNFSTLDVKTVQNGQLRSAGLILMDTSPPDRIRHVMPMPEVPGPDASAPLDMKVSGREIRIVDAAYTQDLDHIGPPELYAWIRFRDAPPQPYLHAALMTQATTHWTIAAALRPHPGMSQALAHVSLSTGPLKLDVSYHDEVDVTQWMLYVNDAVYAGRGQAQGIGKVFSQDGRLLATYAVHAMIRDFDPGQAGGHNAM